MNNKRKIKGLEIDLFAVLANFWKRKYIILLSCIVGAVILLARAVLFITPMYTSAITMYANNSKTTEESTGMTASDISASMKLVSTYEAIILSDPVMELVIEENNLNMTAGQLAGRIAVDSVNNTEVFKVKVTSASPELAAQIANTIAKVAPEKIGSIVDGCSVKVVSYAKVPTAQSSPNYRNAVKLGAVAGLGISMLVIFIITLVDTRIKGEDDLAAWEYPILGMIPSFSTVQKSGEYGYAYKSNAYAAASKGGDK